MRGAWLQVSGIALALVAVTRTTAAHKPITSPFTYSADVRPILRERCGRCHAPGGVGPMSLLTYQSALPWGESMRAELSAGHMPPWRVDRGNAHVRTTTTALTARELNVLLTWATGGAPPGDLAAEPEPPPLTPVWPLGRPDLVLDLPAFTLAAEKQEQLAEFTVPAAGAVRLLRAVDVLPGTPAIVRSATVEVAGNDPTAGLRRERTLSLWTPGDAPVPVTGGAWHVPADATLKVRIRYRKTWSYEGKAMTDRSRLGLYLASTAAPTVQAVSVSPRRAVTLPQALRAIAVYLDAGVSDAGIALTATRPDGRREELIAFRQREGWARRYWFIEPISLPRGSTLSVRVVLDAPSLLPANVATASTMRTNVPVTVDVVP